MVICNHRNKRCSRACPHAHPHKPIFEGRNKNTCAGCEDECPDAHCNVRCIDVKGRECDE